jgi:hypothetical protein
LKCFMITWCSTHLCISIIHLCIHHPFQTRYESAGNESQNRVTKAETSFVNPPPSVGMYHK